MEKATEKTGAPQLPAKGTPIVVTLISDEDERTELLWTDRDVADQKAAEALLDELMADAGSPGEDYYEIGERMLAPELLERHGLAGVSPIVTFTLREGHALGEE